MRTKTVASLFTDYVRHGISPYGACLNTADDISMLARNRANRNECLDALRKTYKEFCTNYQR